MLERLRRPGMGEELSLGVLRSPGRVATAETPPGLLITQRSQVQILSPLHRENALSEII
jgi:hypothetical protein